jgi:hypothetical protein
LAFELSKAQFDATNFAFNTHAHPQKYAMPRHAPCLVVKKMTIVPNFGADFW